MSASKSRLVQGLLVGAAVLATLPGTALAGNEYIEALGLLRKGDAKGIEKMEAVCKKEPFASNAFLELSRGYLRIKNDAGMAMDAAVRGLEQYDEKWQYKVPKAALYDAFSAAAARGTPEALARYVPRVDKLAKRDGAAAQPVLTRFDAYRPAKLVPALLAQAQAAEGQGAPGQALRAYDLAAEAAKAGGIEAEHEAGLKRGRDLAEKARKEFETAAAGEGEKRTKDLQAIATRYAGHAIAKQAQDKLEELKKAGSGTQPPAKEK